MKNTISILSFAALSFAATTAEAEPLVLRQLLPMEADIVGAQGRVELELPDDVVAACRSDLSDLRIFDLEDREVAYAFAAAEPIEPQEDMPQVEAAEILEVAREEVRRKEGPPLYRESYELAAPKNPPPNGIWELQVDSSRPQFVRQARVAAIEGGEALVSTESVFRMAGASKVRLSLPTSDFRRLRVTLEGEDDSFLEPSFSFHSRRSVNVRAPILITLERSSSQTRAGTTAVVVKRPSGIVPVRLRIETTTPWFDRAVNVWDVRRGHADRHVGGGRIERSEDGDAPEGRDVSIDAAFGDELRVEIVGGDSPELDELRIVAIAPRPRLVFVASGVGPDGRNGVLRFGGGRVRRPHYDVSLAAVASPGPGSTTGARIVRTRANPSYRAEPSLAFAMRPGARVDRGLYARSRSLVVQPSAEGVSRLRLEPSDLAVVRPDLADLRIVDAEQRQWPFLVNRTVDPEEISLAIARVVHEKGTSRYVFIPPVTPLLLHEVSIETDAQLIDRAAELTAAIHGRKPLLLAGGKLKRSVGAPAPLRIAFPPTHVDSLELAIENGDDSPIEIRSARSTVELPEILLVAPAGEYTLLLDYPEAGAPQYEVAQAHEAVIAAPAAEIRKGELADNPHFSARARLTTDEALRSVPRLLLWVALIGAVGVLGVITARIVRSEPPASDGHDL